jgi:hypothetical protein
MKSMLILLVAARTRQLNHRLKGRKQAILDRRATASPAPPVRPLSPSNVALMNGGPSHAPQAHAHAHAQPSQKSPGGFVAVNARPHESNGHSHGHGHGNSHGNGASSSTRHDLLAKFHTVNDRRSSSQNVNGVQDARRPSVGPHPPSHPSTPASNASRPPPPPAEAQPPPPPSNHARPPQMNEAELQSMMNSPVPIPNTPTSLLPAASQRTSQPAEKDDGGPFKAEMVHRMESLGKGERILPPCDRCRRLHMDCLKNLTACMGCTKKHAKCSWKEVREGELHSAFPHPPGSNSNAHTDTSDHESRASTASPPSMMSPPHGYASSHIASSNGQSTPQPQATAHPPAQPQQPHQQQPPQPQQQHQIAHQHRPHPPQAPQYPHAHDSRIPSGRNSPPERDRERERHVEAQLQEAAKSSLAQHATTKPSEAKGHEYQTAIAQQ